MKRPVGFLSKSKKALLSFLLTVNLVLVSTGSAELESTPSASPDSSSVLSTSELISPTPSPTIASSETLKINPSGTFVEDEIVVKFKEEATPSEKSQILAESELTEDKEEPTLKVKLLKVSPEKRDRALEKLSKNPKVEYTHLNHVGKITEYFGGGGGSVTSPNDPYYGSQWHLNKILAPVVWNSYKGSANIKVGVLDTGVNYNLTEFGANPSAGARTTKGKDFVNNDMDPMDDNGHGTAVTSVLGVKTNNGVDLAAVDWYSHIIVVKTNDSAGNVTSFNMAQGIVWAVNYTSLLKVINISSSFSVGDQTLLDGVNYALNSNVLVVAGTANNYSTSNCAAGYPASYSGVLAVMATNSADGFATGCSQAGQGSLMSAPGYGIYTEKATGGVNVPNAIFTSGTSFAAPLVAGVASVLYSCAPSGYSRNNMRIALMLGQDLGLPGYDSTYGYGRLDMFKSKTAVPGCEG